jgi:uncharacterized protein DUF1572
MTDSFTPHYLANVTGEFRQLKDLAEKAIAQVNDQHFFTVLDDEANSIAVLMKHIAGSMQARWTGFPTTAEGAAQRQRDREFIMETVDTKAALLEQWEAGWQSLFEALGRVTSANIQARVLIRGQPHSVLEAINRQLIHYSYHVGQIVLLAKYYRSSAWQSLSIPRGKSAEFEVRIREGQDV